MNKLDNIIFKLIDKQVSECDTYIHNGGIWLIFTDKKQWAVEFTSSGGLWYNYYFFNEIFGWIGVSDKINYYVEKWFQLRILNKEKVEDTIQNGVKYTSFERIHSTLRVEDTIQNGVKYTTPRSSLDEQVNVEDTIQNGVKHTSGQIIVELLQVEDTIQNGVKYTLNSMTPCVSSIEDTIKNGVKHTIMSLTENELKVEDTIQNGIKETTGTLRRTLLGVDDIIQNGVKCNLLQNNLESEIKIIS